MVIHPFHPLAGQRLQILGRERRGETLCFHCRGGPLGTVMVPLGWTDRADPPVATRLTYEVLAELAAAVAGIRRGGAAGC